MLGAEVHFFHSFIDKRAHTVQQRSYKYQRKHPGQRAKPGTILSPAHRGESAKICSAPYSSRYRSMHRQHTLR